MSRGFHQAQHKNAGSVTDPSTPGAEFGLLLTNSSQNATLGGKGGAGDLQVLAGGIRGRDAEVAHVLQRKGSEGNETPWRAATSSICSFLFFT